MADKEVTYKNLKPGQKIKGIKGHKRHSYFSGYVTDINTAYVTIAMWRKDGILETYNSDYTFIVEMSREECRSYYNKAAGELIKALHNRLSIAAIGYHEIDNSWFESNPWEMAATCKKKKYRVLGYCLEIPQKRISKALVFDVGICAEDEEGHRFWCHARTDFIKIMVEMYECYQKWRKGHEGDIDMQLAMVPLCIRKGEIC